MSNNRFFFVFIAWKWTGNKTSGSWPITVVPFTWNRHISVEGNVSFSSFINQLPSLKAPYSAKGVLCTIVWWRPLNEWLKCENCFASLSSVILACEITREICDTYFYYIFNYEKGRYFSLLIIETLLWTYEHAIIKWMFRVFKREACHWPLYKTDNVHWPYYTWSESMK